MYSTNLLVLHDALALVSGSPKQYSKPTDAGNIFTSNFCGDCGTTMWRESTGYPGIKFLKEGILESAPDAKPALEVYIVNRADWQAEVPGAEQKERQ
ncbi:hypothetical protein MMC11_002993 [Xylographa trunciseda]|nr:hypothetical protein [Xylographa trunciseda]